MAGKNLSPRQQMIGLMYLVLLAMLAMNASKDLLDAFIYLENGIEKTSQNFVDNNQAVVDKIAMSTVTGSEKAKESLLLAKEIQGKTKTLIATIDNFKAEIVEKGGGKDENDIPLGKDNQDVGAEFLIFKKNGEVLKKELKDYKEFLISCVNESDNEIIQSVNALLNTPDYVDYEGNKLPWENGISEHLPLVAVTANLTNVQTYIYNSEAQVLNHLQEQISLDAYKVNKILATTLSEKSYILQGDEYEANVFLAAADTTQEPLILIGEYDTTLFKQKRIINFLSKVDTLDVKQGKGKYTVKSQEVGNHTWGGIMRVPHPNPKKKGMFLDYPFESSYTVATPTAVISSEQLQVMYMGLNNVINVSAPGIQQNQIKVEADKSVVRELSNGRFSVVPNRLGSMTIKVYIQNEEGKRLIATQHWTSKKLPTPLITLLDNPISAYENANRLRIPGKEYFGAMYPASFPIQEQPQIIKCKVSSKVNGSWITHRPFTRNGEFNNDFKTIIPRYRKGDEFEITMTVKTQDGVTHQLTQFVKIK